MGGKERRGRKVRSVFCLVGEKLRKGKENGGNGFLLDSPFYFLPNWKEMRKMREQYMGPTRKSSLPSIPFCKPKTILSFIFLSHFPFLFSLSPSDLLIMQSLLKYFQFKIFTIISFYSFELIIHVSDRSISQSITLTFFDILSNFKK